MLSHIKQFLRSNVLYQKYAQTWINDSRYAVRNLRLTLKDYHGEPKPGLTGSTLYFILDPRQHHPGFADRLKVFCCLKHIARHNGLAFKMVLTKDFPLAKYLEPTEADWRASADELSYCRKQVKLIAYNGGKHTLPTLKANVRQYHIYNYIGLDIIRRTYGDRWREVWRESYNQMFRPTAYLESLLGQFDVKDYTAIHIRFVNAFDPQETGYYNALDKEGQQRLIDKCLAALADIKKQEEHPLLIFSDSERFLKVAQSHGYQRIEGGKVGHVSFCPDALEKTVIDFFMLSRAHRIIRLTCPEIYGSTFPIYASYVGGCRIWEYEVDRQRLSMMSY